MKNICWCLAGCLAAGFTALGADIVIDSMDANGKLVFNEVSNATAYRVEWAPGVNGPWTNAWAGLNDLPATGSGAVTASVPMVYRVVANVIPQDTFLVIDLAGGTGATSYAVSYLPAVPPGGWTDEYKTSKLVLRKITHGAFTIGSPTSELGHRLAEAEHLVTLTKDYYIGVFEVTQEQWFRVMGTWPGWFTNPAYRAARPVESISYYDIRENPANTAISPNWPQSNQVHADSFMGKLRAKTGLATLDLPTEAQWEYAGRAGTATALNTGHNLTNLDSDVQLDQAGRYYYNGGSAYSQNGGPAVGTALVGSYLANQWELYDVHGNVAEFCLDWSDDYPSGAVEDPPGAATGSSRIARGGSWVDVSEFCRAAYRSGDGPTSRPPDYGLRVAMTLP